MIQTVYKLHSLYNYTVHAVCIQFVSLQCVCSLYTVCVITLCMQFVYSLYNYTVYAVCIQFV